jgi:hypothetical protein
MPINIAMEIILIYFFSKWTNWTQCKISFVVCVMNRQQDFILELSHVKDANRFLAARPTTSPSFRSAKITTDASSTRRTELLAKHADSESV